jgi:hypothetical protein
VQMVNKSFKRPIGKKSIGEVEAGAGSTESWETFQFEWVGKLFFMSCPDGAEASSSLSRI